MQGLDRRARIRQAHIRFSYFVHRKELLYNQPSLEENSVTAPSATNCRCADSPTQS
jgi:hypothetical protein